MKLQRSKNTKRNVVVGLLSKLVAVLLPFVTQTFFIYILGNEYNGLKGMFSSMLQVLSVAELGFGSAMIFSMYKPIAEDDDSSICALLNLYRKTYRIIGIIILLAGVVVVPLLRFFVKDNDYPCEINIYIVYLVYLLNTVVSYWMYSYKSSIIAAFQRQDVISAIGMITSIITNAMQICVLVLWRNFYFYIVVLLAGTILNNLIVSFYVDRNYPQYKCAGLVSKDELQTIRKKVAGLAISRVCYVTRNGFDNIFLSAFLGLEVVGIYNLYYNYIFLNVITLLGIVTTAMLAGIGNSIASETVEKNYADFRKLDFIYMILSGFCVICMFCLYQPFMRAWVGEKSMFSDGVVVLLCVYFYISCMGSVRSLYSDGAGLWWENKHRVIAEMICNIVLNFILGKIFGVYGIIAATCISLFSFGYVGSAIVLFRNYYSGGLKKYFASHFTYAVVTLINCLIVRAVCGLIIVDNKWLNLLLRLGVCIIISPVIYLLFYFKTDIFSLSKSWLIKRMSFLQNRE